ncbi:hypothetical protein FQR65_LT05374 [Abscondita terminalis]|nr:hypothetical protein FQR65_LT05374 [Abscondita terminalis]
MYRHNQIVMHVNAFTEYITYLGCYNRALKSKRIVNVDTIHCYILLVKRPPSSSHWQLLQYFCRRCINLIHKICSWVKKTHYK